MNPHDIKVEVGLATKVGYALGVAQIAIAALIPIVDGIPDDASTASVIVALVLGATAVITRVNDGRQTQAAALYRDAPSPAQVDDFSGDADDVLDDDDDETLAAQFDDFSGDDGAPDDETLAAQFDADSPFAEPGVDAPPPEGAVGGKPVAEAR